MDRGFHKLIAATLFAVGTLLRVLLAPYSTGSDIAQFYGFAKSFSPNPLCIYIHGSSRGEEWPYSWLYPYGPLLGFILTGLYRLVDGPSLVEWWWEGSRYVVVVDRIWIIAVKSVFIAGDVFSALMLYMVLKRRIGSLALLASSLYYSSFMSVYVSSIYGMFDSIPLGFMLLSIALLSRSYISGLLAGVAVSFKQTMLFPALLLGLGLWFERGSRYSLSYAMGFLLGFTAPLALVTLLCPESTPGLVKALIYQSQIYYPRPLVYSMNGIASIATYLNDAYGYDTLNVLKLWPVIAGALLIATILSYRRMRDPIMMASLGYIVFIASYWRVNPQYLSPLIAFAIILLALHESRAVRISSSTLVVVASLWPHLYPIDFWFHVHINEPVEWIRVVSRLLSLDVFNESFYIAYSVLLTTTSIITVLTAVLSRRC